jgi:hypothetical protein
MARRKCAATGNRAPRKLDGRSLHVSAQWQKRVFEGGWARRGVAEGVRRPRRDADGAGAVFTQEMAQAGAPPLANVLGLAIIGRRSSITAPTRKKRATSQHSER